MSEYSNKNGFFAFLLCIFFGPFGFHRFYVGKNISGVFYIFTFGFLGVGWIVDVVKLLHGTFLDKSGKPLKLNIPFA